MGKVPGDLISATHRQPQPLGAPKASAVASDLETHIQKFMDNLSKRGHTKGETEIAKHIARTHGEEGLHELKSRLIETTKTASKGKGRYENSLKALQKSEKAGNFHKALDDFAAHNPPANISSEPYELAPNVPTSEHAAPTRKPREQAASENPTSKRATHTREPSESAAPKKNSSTPKENPHKTPTSKKPEKKPPKKSSQEKPPPERPSPEKPSASSASHSSSQAESNVMRAEAHAVEAAEKTTQKSWWQKIRSKFGSSAVNAEEKALVATEKKIGTSWLGKIRNAFRLPASSIGYGEQKAIEASTHMSPLGAAIIAGAAGVGAVALLDQASDSSPTKGSFAEKILREREERTKFNPLHI